MVDKVDKSKYAKGWFCTWPHCPIGMQMCLEELKAKWTLVEYVICEEEPKLTLREELLCLAGHQLFMCCPISPLLSAMGNAMMPCWRHFSIGSKLEKWRNLPSPLLDTKKKIIKKIIKK